MRRKGFSAKIDPVKWDFRAVKSKSAQIMATGQIKAEITAEVIAKVELLKNLLISQVRNHNVSQDIENGKSDPSGDYDSSGCCGGYGNLWAFIGFNKGDEPINQITSTIENHKTFVSVRPYKDVVRVTATIPTKEDAYANTPMPWSDGRSWAQGIALGIAGWGRFLSTGDAKTSKSGGGIQVDHDNLSSGSFPRPPKFQRTSYLAPIFAAASTRLNSLLRENFTLTKSK